MDPQEEHDLEMMLDLLFPDRHPPPPRLVSSGQGQPSDKPPADLSLVCITPDE